MVLLRQATFSKHRHHQILSRLTKKNGARIVTLTKIDDPLRYRSRVEQNSHFNKPAMAPVPLLWEKHRLSKTTLSTKDSQ